MIKSGWILILSIQTNREKHGKTNGSSFTISQIIHHLQHVPKRNNVSRFESTKLIKSKLEAPNLKKLLTQREFCN